MKNTFYLLITAILLSNTAFAQQEKRPTKKSFQCDHRQYCSQMTSYDEALFFTKNCPNTKMDGDKDGIPCERQYRKEIENRIPNFFEKKYKSQNK